MLVTVLLAQYVSCNITLMKTLHHHHGPRTSRLTPRAERSIEPCDGRVTFGVGLGLLRVVRVVYDLAVWVFSRSATTDGRGHSPPTTEELILSLLVAALLELNVRPPLLVPLRRDDVSTFLRVSDGEVSSVRRSEDSETRVLEPLPRSPSHRGQKRLHTAGRDVYYKVLYLSGRDSLEMVRDSM